MKTNEKRKQHHTKYMKIGENKSGSTRRLREGSENKEAARLRRR